MNWGKALAVLLISFISFIGFLAYKMISSKIELVNKDFYSAEIQFQKRIDQKQNTLKYEQKPEITDSGNEIKIDFKSPVEKGIVEFYKPNNAQSDFSREIEPLSQKLAIGKSKLEKGRWLIKITWDAQNKTFYSEQTVII
ncbi:FixH family protein [Marinilongibacter aquaticus]|uniref:FixH family protein n=1 Tax=Marinilongibacter aquaticus TaxID=2975157 RepID=UPI0021BD4FA4|nr:FixH family protein [Marinilongibacter aquaticus]UBM58549.1 FixH family protein [Marinilongibacter aquaticus]